MNLKNDKEYAFRILSEFDFEFVLKLIHKNFPNIDLDDVNGCIDRERYDQWLYFHYEHNDYESAFCWDQSDVIPANDCIIVKVKPLLRKDKLKRINDYFISK